MNSHEEIKKLVEAVKADRETGTEGPWAESRFCETSIEGKGCRQVASSGGYQDNCSDGRYVYENRANARRIARVPDLEDALIHLQEWVVEWESAVIFAVDLLRLYHREWMPPADATETYMSARQCDLDTLEIMARKALEGEL